MGCAMRAHGLACARALPRPLKGPPRCIAKRSNHCGRRGSAPYRALRRSTPITHRAHARSAAQTILYCAPVWPRPSRRTTVASCRREDGCSGATLRSRESNDEHHSTICAAPAARLGYALRTHTHPHGIGALRAAQRRPVLWRRARAFRASFHGTHDALNVAHTPRLKRTRTENGLAKTEPPPAAVTPACRYAYACMCTPRWKMPYSSRKQLRCVCMPSQSAVVHPLLQRRMAHRVLQQHFAGSCDNATDTVAHLLQRRIACCNGAPHGACDDATNSVAHLLQRRVACCHRAQCDNAELLHESAVCCNGACCNSVRFCCRTGRRSTCCSALQRCSLL